MIVIIALLLRVGFVIVEPPVARDVFAPLADSTDYDHLARALLRGEGFVNLQGNPTAFRPPVYPVFVAMVYAVAGEQNLMAVALVQAALGAVATLLVYLLARRAAVDRAGALCAALLYACYPAFIVQVPQVLSEELGRVLLLGAVFFMMEDDGKNWMKTALAGAILAVAILNKSVLAAAVPFLCLALLWGGNRAMRERLVAATAFALPLCLVIGGWTLRNASVSGSFIPVSTNFPITFAHGVTKWNVQANEWYGRDTALLPVPEDFRDWTQLRTYHDIGQELEVGREWGRKAGQWTSDHGWLFGVMSVRKGLHFWGCFIRGSLLERLVAALSMGTVILGGWLFLILQARTSPPAMRRFALLAFAVAFSVTIPYAISQCDVRYRLSLIDPLWMVFCGALLAPMVAPFCKSPSEG